MRPRNKGLAGKNATDNAIRINRPHPVKGEWFGKEPSPVGVPEQGRQQELTKDPNQLMSKRPPLCGKLSGVKNRGDEAED